MMSPDRRTLLKMAGLPVAATAAGSSAAAQTTAPPSLQDGIDPRSFGMRADGVTDDTAALRAAVRHCLETGAPILRLPRGKIRLSGDIRIESADPAASQRQLILRGAGAGVNGSWLYFERGTLLITLANHRVEDLRVTAAQGNGIEVRSAPAPAAPAARSGMRNVRTDHCSGSGLLISDTWIYLLEDIVSMANGAWGLVIDLGPRWRMGCNGLAIVGGEYQGNGRANQPTSGGGILIAGRCTQVSLFGTTIEGNRGDGLRLAAAVRGLALTGVYFEKNGAAAANCDIVNYHSGSFTPSASAMIVNCNFSPGLFPDGAQRRAISLTDFADLRIVNPQFYGTGAGTIYALSPILVGESRVGATTGWVEGGYFTTAKYRQNPILENNTARFGFPRTDRFSLSPAAGADVDLVNLVVPLSVTAARSVEVTYFLRAAQPQPAPVYLDARCGDATNLAARSRRDLAATRAMQPIKQTVSLAADQQRCGFVELTLHPAGQGSAVTALAAEVVTYEGAVGAK